MMIAYRVILRDLIKFLDISSSKSSKKVLIYGAGDSGAQLASSIKFTKNKKIGVKIKNIGEKILKVTIKELDNLINNEFKKT